MVREMQVILGCNQPDYCLGITADYAGSPFDYVSNSQFPTYTDGFCLNPEVDVDTPDRPLRFRHTYPLGHTLPLSAQTRPAEHKSVVDAIAPPNASRDALAVDLLQCIGGATGLQECQHKR
jgi:hypothetical protein